MLFIVFFFQAEDGIRDLVRSRGLGDVYKRQSLDNRLRGVSSASVLAFLLSALSLAWVLFVIPPQTYRPLMLLVGVWATLRLKPSAGRWGPALDLVWVVVTMFGLGWPLAQGEAFWYRAANPTGGDVVAGMAALLVITEAVRRTTGWALPIVTVGFLAYAVFGPALASIGLADIAHRGYDLPRLVGNLYMTLEGIYGVPLDVAVTHIPAFRTYWPPLLRSCARPFFPDFGLSLSAAALTAAAFALSAPLAGCVLGAALWARRRPPSRDRGKGLRPSARGRRPRAQPGQGRAERDRRDPSTRGPHETAPRAPPPPPAAAPTRAPKRSRRLSTPSFRARHSRARATPIQADFKAREARLRAEPTAPQTRKATLPSLSLIHISEPTRPY